MRQMINLISMGLLLIGVACSSDQKQQEEAIQGDDQDAAQFDDDNEDNEDELNESQASIVTGDGSPADRVVVFVLKNNTPIFSEASGESPQAGGLMQGDPLVIYPTNSEWGQITTGRYIQLTDITRSVVPRSKGFNKWIAQQAKPKENIKTEE